MAKEIEKRLVRRDATGHMNPDYERDLLALSGRHGVAEPPAFVNAPNTRDEFAEAFGEGAVLAMTTGADGEQQLFDQVVTEEWGGPFIVTPSRIELASEFEIEDEPSTILPKL